VNIDEQLARKLVAVGASASQPELSGCLERDLIRSSAAYWSRFGDRDGRFAEAFEVDR
jgi:hypothetical protein